MYKKIIALICFLALLFFSLMNVANEEVVSDNINENKISIEEVKDVKKIFYNVPNPMELIGLIKKIELVYNADLMNPISNSENYLSQADIALNLGVYAADLSYVRIYEQYQDAAHYLAILKRFSRELGIPEEEEKRSIQMFESGIDNRDSLLNEISNIYAKSDGYLKDNDRAEIAALIVLGGWIETLYLATNVLDDKIYNKELVSLISEQKYSIKNLIGLLQQFKEHKKISEILPELIKLDNKFQEIEEKRKSTRVKRKSGKTIISNKITLITSNNTINEIRKINNRIRLSITEL